MEEIVVKVAATLEMIKCCFAGCEQEVERAFAASESFRGLCRDYLACAMALTRWRGSTAAETPLRVREYSEMLAELTIEIEARLSQFSDAGHGSGFPATNQPKHG